MKIGGDGRPKKHSTENQRMLARCFLDIKKREPHVTQEIYAKNYGISGRTLRRYIQRFFALEALELKEAEIKKKKDELRKSLISDSQVTDTKEECGGLMVAWT